jgi:WD40 repeat protein
MQKNAKNKKKNDILLSVLDFLDRNGYKHSYEKLKQALGKHYYENDKKIVEDLLNLRKIDELILHIKNSFTIKNEDKIDYIKSLKIKKYIDLIIKNCSDRIDQRDSLDYLRNEIVPIISNNTKDKNLLIFLTNILFYKDMNLLKDYINKYLKIYLDDSAIISELSKNKIVSVEKLYDNYNDSDERYKELLKNYKSISISEVCIPPYKPTEIWFLEISKNKKCIALGFAGSNISLISVNKKNGKIELNLYATFSANDKSHKGEISSMNFSYDEKHLLVSLTNGQIKIYNVSNGEKINEYKNLHNEIPISCIYLPNSNNKFLSGGIDKKLILTDKSNEQNPHSEIGKFCRIKQLLFSEIHNLIIIIPGSSSDIICYDLSRNKISFKIEIKEELVYSNISIIDKGKYILLNISKAFPKILLYNLAKVKTEEKYYGHKQKNMIIKCSFAGDKEQYIISGSEDAKV